MNTNYFYIKSISGQIYKVNQMPKYSAGYALATEEEVAEYERKRGEIPAIHF